MKLASSVVRSAGHSVVLCLSVTMDELQEVSGSLPDFPSWNVLEYSNSQEVFHTMKDILLSIQVESS